MAQSASNNAAKSEQQKSRVKTMLIAFYRDIPFGHTVNATFYLSVLKQIVTCIRRVRPEYREPRSRAVNGAEVLSSGCL